MPDSSLDGMTPAALALRVHKQDDTAGKSYVLRRVICTSSNPDPNSRRYFSLALQYVLHCSHGILIPVRITYTTPSIFTKSYKISFRAVIELLKRHYSYPQEKHIVHLFRSMPPYHIHKNLYSTFFSMFYKA